MTNSAAALAGSVQEDTTLSASGQLAASDVDQGATQTWSIQGNGQGAYGALALDASGKWTYTLANGTAAVQALAAGETHDETFPVRVTDDKGAFVDQTVTVTVAGTNDTPVITNSAAALAGSVQEDTTLSASGQLAASDVDQGATQTWSIQGNGQGAYGALALDASGKWTYTLANGTAAVQALAAGETHDETFPVRVTDDKGAFVDQTVTVTVAGTNDTPVITNSAAALAGSVQEDTTLSASGQLAASDVDQGATQTWSIQGNGQGAYGALALDASGKWTYTLANGTAAVQALAAGETHDETFPVRVTDDKGAFVDQTVTVTVAGTNDTPVITNSAAALAGSVQEDTTLSASGQLAASDVDQGATQTWSIQGNGQGAYGALALDASGKWTYTLANGTAAVQALAAGETHDETFPVRVTDDKGAFVDQTVTVTVAGTNDTPVITNSAAALAGSVQEDTTLSASGQLAASDVDQGATQTWSIQGNGQGAYGALALDASGKWTYTLANGTAAVQALAAGETHDETFPVRVTDDKGAFVDQTVTVTVAGTNDTPVITNSAAALAGSVQEDTTLSASGQLAASDVDQGATQTWSIQGNGQGAYGALALDASGKWTYTLANGTAAVQALAAGETHDETFPVRVTDDKGAFVDQTVTVTVAGTNDTPVITNSAAALAGSVQEDTTLSASGQLAASDVDQGATQTWSIQGNGQGAYGALALNASGKWTYTLANGTAAVQALAAGETHDETFTVRVTDDKGAFVDQTVTVTVAGTNDTPVITNSAAALAGSVQEDTTLSASGQLATSDVDQGATQTWSIQGNGQGAYGALALNASGKWTYTLANGTAAVQALAAGETHDETFTVRVTDDKGAFVDQTVTVTVAGTNDAAVLSSATANLTEANSAAAIST